MGVNKMIYDSNDLTHYSDDMIKRIDKAILAAAFHIRDNMRQAFISGSSIYKYRTGKLDKLAEGIQVGKINDSKHCSKVILGPFTILLKFEFGDIMERS